MEKGSASKARWLLLVHQLPSEPSKLRVKVWRRLQGVGAVLLKGSVYALPHTAESREDFEWIRSEISSSGGEALVFDAEAVDELDSTEIAQAFREARGADWQELEERAVSLTETWGTSGAGDEGSGASAFERELRALRNRAAQLDRIDFFRAPGRQAALDAVERADLRRRSGGEKLAGPPGGLDPADYRARQWLTRPQPGVDRMASAWLIRRFVDPEAEFRFADRVPTGADLVPFDMFGVDLGHQGEACTFETIAARFALDEPALRRIARIVHVLDLRGEIADDVEAVTVGRVVEGLRASSAADDAVLEQGMSLFEALYQSFRREESDLVSGDSGTAS